MSQKSKKYKFYTDGTITKAFYEGDEIPPNFVPGRANAPWNKGLDASTDERVKANTDVAHQTRRDNGNYNAWNKGLTKETDVRVANYAVCLQGENNPMYGTHKEAWNKGLTKDTDIRLKFMSENLKGRKVWNKGVSCKGHPQSDESKEKIRVAHLDASFKDTRYKQMKANGTLFVSESKAEKEYYAYLLERYDESDVIRQYFDKDRYPFKCDFYIVSEDKFIEVNANWTHGGKPFDANDAECIEKLNLWQEKAEKSKYYKMAIYTWTDLDVRKLQTAQQNNLNFEAIY